MDSLPPATVAAVLSRLGFTDWVAPDRAGLDAVYLAWCRSVPFDNLVKRIGQVAGTAPFRNDEPEGFFALWLEHTAPAERAGLVPVRWARCSTRSTST